MSGIIPINVDRNVSVADYRQLTAQNLLLVTSIFTTIQGEGPFAGRRAVFVRLAGCNIGAKEDCQWCDTAFQFDRGERMSPEFVLNECEAVSADLVVITGGEPLLQWPVLRYMFNLPQARRIIWQFETNGLLLKADVLADASLAGAHIQFVVSPKVPHNKTSYPTPRPEWTRGPVVLKYVVEADTDSPYHRPGPIIPETPGRHVYISGMTVYRRPCRPGEIANLWDDTLIDREATARNYAWAAQVVMQHGLPYRLSYQTHLLANLE